MNKCSNNDIAFILDIEDNIHRIIMEVQLWSIFQRMKSVKNGRYHNEG